MAMDNPNIIPDIATTKYADAWANELRNQLIRAGKDASGQLIRSIRPEILATETGAIIQILAEPYLQYVDSGRKPGGKRVPIAALQQWISVRGIRPRAGMSVLALPWAIQNKIFKFGIAPTDVVAKTIREMGSVGITDFESEIAIHLENTIIQTLDPK
jgi:hypothetical protein